MPATKLGAVAKRASKSEVMETAVPKPVEEESA